MVTVLSGGTGAPKLVAGAMDRPDLTVVGNTGDDALISGNLVCPDLDSLTYLGAGLLDRETWWGLAGDPAETNEWVHRLATDAGLEPGPRYLPEKRQTSGRRIARWRRYSGVGEFMHVGDRDRAIHITRTGLIDEGHSLTTATRTIADALEVPFPILPMSDDPVATIIHTPDGEMHFQEFWIAHEREPAVEAVEFRGQASARPTDAVLRALEDSVIVGPSNPVTSIGPICALSGVVPALEETPVVAVSPFVEDRVFSGPAGKLLAATGHAPATAGVASAYPFADAFVLDESDGTDLERPVVRTDITMDSAADARRVFAACESALEMVS